MFSRKMVTFFRGLEKNNRREWFAPRKELFETEVRAPLIDVVQGVNEAVKRFAVENAVAEPAKALYRIYRDTRFSKDKSPYKLHLGALFPRQGLPKHGGASFYFGVSHKCVQVAGGVYEPGPHELAALRRAMAADSASFLKLIGDPKVTRAMGKIQGARLTRVPKGFEGYTDRPIAEYLKMKAVYWYVELPVDVALSGKVVKEVVKRFELMGPAARWMNEAVLAGRADGEDERPRRPEPMW